MGWLLLLVLPGQADGATALREAYAVEQRVLQSEKAELQRSIEVAGQSTQTARAALEADIESLTVRLVRLRADNAAKEKSLPARERTRTAAAQQRELEEVVDQMRHWLSVHGVSAHAAPAGDAQDPHALLSPYVHAALDHVRDHGQLRVEQQAEFFGLDGIAQKGDVLRVGGVGATRWGEASAPLFETLDGTLREAPLDPTEARVLGEGRLVDVLLYDPNEPPTADQFHRRGLAAWLRAGGPLMWPLLAMAFAALLVILERTWVLWGAASRWRSVERVLEPTLQASGEADWSRLEAVSQSGILGAPLAAVLSERSAPRAILEERATEALLRVRPWLYRRLSLLSVTAAAAPLIGLLGTVTGMIATFSVITEHGTGDPRLLSDGISEALLTTQLGLAVAIPALLANTGFHRWAHRVFSACEARALAVIHRLDDDDMERG